METLVIHAQGSNKEVPPGVPQGLWIEDLRFLADLPNRDELLAELTWVHPVMEYLEPKLLLRFKVQVLIWRQYTGEFPDEVAWWWPVRFGRRRGQVPHMSEVTEAYIDSSGTLHCGRCESRWSANHDGSPRGFQCGMCDKFHTDRCKLCDRIMVIVRDDSEVYY